MVEACSRPWAGHCFGGFYAGDAKKYASGELSSCNTSEQNVDYEGLLGEVTEWLKVTVC